MHSTIGSQYALLVWDSKKIKHTKGLIKNSNWIMYGARTFKSGDLWPMQVFAQFWINTKPMRTLKSNLLIKRRQFLLKLERSIGRLYYIFFFQIVEVILKLLYTNKNKVFFCNTVYKKFCWKLLNLTKDYSYEIPKKIWFLRYDFLAMGY